MPDVILFIKRDGTQVVAVFHSQIPTSTPMYHFTWNANSENHAELLRKQLADVMEKEVRAIREQAYLAGYKDGRAKKAKRPWFSPLFQREA